MLVEKTFVEKNIYNKKKKKKYFFSKKENNSLIMHTCIHAIIRSREIQCLPYARFIKENFDKMGIFSQEMTDLTVIHRHKLKVPRLPWFYYYRLVFGALCILEKTIHYSSLLLVPAIFPIVGHFLCSVVV